MILNVALVAGCVYALLVAGVYVAQPKLVYFSEVGRELVATPAAVGLEFDDLQLTTADGVRLHAWYVKTKHPRGVVLFFHGNAGNISHRLDSLAQFARLGYDTLIFDYRGYGRSDGSPSEAGTYLDGEAAWDHLVRKRGVAPADVVLFGESLGAAVAAGLASHSEPRALIMLSAFTSIPELGQELYPILPVKWLARIRYPTLEYVQAVRAPVLVAHSRDDEIVPFSHGERLYAAASEPKRFLAMHGGHNEAFFFVRPEWERALADFLDDADPKARPAASVGR
ncbi:MAG TPA: alpha/beta hydrolase [Pelomicrobium sp.]|nr:alpha/beta hydrolase [Pelomicrobium sp.]